MIKETLYDDGRRRWLFFGRDPDRSGVVIDTNQYLITNDGWGLLPDPGGTEIFPAVAAVVSGEIELSRLKGIFGSHQDPDIISSLGLWRDICPDIDVHVPSTWESFVPHFGGCETLIPIPDAGGSIALGDGPPLQLIPAHYLHSSGNFSLYDPVAKILFSGDIGAALLPDSEQGIFVEDFDNHTRFMEGFHRRRMPSNSAKNDWIRRVRGLDIELLCPQHGAVFRAEDTGRFLDWFEALEVGAAVRD